MVPRNQLLWELMLSQQLHTHHSLPLKPIYWQMGHLSPTDMLCPTVTFASSTKVPHITEVINSHEESHINTQSNSRRKQAQDPE